MLEIGNKNIKVINENIYLGEIWNKQDKGYDICISIDFINLDNNKKGYINIAAGFSKEKDINKFLNKEYYGNPSSNNNQLIFFETYDTEEFIDTQIDSKIQINIKDKIDNKIEVSFIVNDELIKINYNGLLDINNNITRESFC